MSWTSYIDSLTSVENGFQVIQHAAIWSKKSPSLWATSDGFNTVVEDIKQLLSDRNGLFVNGVKVAGEKYVLVKDDLETEGIYMMNLRSHKNSDGNIFYMSIGMTQQTFIIVKGTLAAQGGQVSEKLYKTIDYLRKQNY